MYGPLSVQELQHMNGAETETQTVVKEEKPPELVESWSKGGEVNAEIVNPVSALSDSIMSIFYPIRLRPAMAHPIKKYLFSSIGLTVS